MKELIKITEKQTVNARDLHKFLEVKARFNDWIRTNLEFIEAQEGVHFTLLKNKYATSLDKSRKDYFLILDTAKELSMLQRNEKGRQARRYFIECEKKLKEVLAIPDFSNPAAAARAWAVEYEQKIEAQKAKQLTEKENDRLISINTQHQNTILEFTPKISYVDTILSSTNTLTVTQIAKDYGISATKLNRILHSEEVQYKNNGQWLLYSKYAGHGYTQSRTHKYLDKKGSEQCKVDTRWTQKGRMFLHEFLKKNNIFPQCELHKGA